MQGWIRKPYTIEFLGGDRPAMPRMSLQSYLNNKRLQLEFSKQNLCHFWIITRN